ncbi:MXAN_6640 family putative metalloprotease [Nocardioides campestrisoli]|uniref:MXAN_6640 family putative metalloprotease n=1 Tax=Nocardioides campestrisoli TaxID=2736757 RepID=UPI00163D78D8|nr:MXAN_6640 family putative metalloprotease [Nocardioides campestrisoli]
MRRPAAAFLAALPLLLTGFVTAPAQGALPGEAVDVVDMVDVVDGTADGEGDAAGDGPPPELAEAQELLLADAGENTPDGNAPQAPDVREDAADVTMVLRDLFLARPGMDREDRRLATRLLARPTVPGTDTWASYDPEQPTAQRCNARICVTYVTGGNDRATPAWADQTLAAVDEAWTGQVDRMGYPAPASDGTAGGDARFDVYLANISDQGLYGYCVPEGRVPGQPGKSSSYCVLDNDMVGFSDTPSASLHVTAVHEFFHAVQFNVDVREDRWWMEATATWMEEVLADSVNDNRQFLSAGQLGRPGVSLDSYSADQAMYGNWIFVQRLAQSLGQDSIRQIWTRLDSAGRDEYSVQGIRRYLASRNRSWGKFYARFVESNLSPRRYYDEGRAYRKAPLGRKLRIQPGRPTRKVSVRVPHLAAHTVQLRAGRALHPRARLHLRVEAAKGRAADPVARVLVHKTDGGLRRFDVRLDRSGRGSRTVGLQRGRIRKIVVVLSNTSTRYRGCGGPSAWACGGKAVDDDQRFTLTAVARPAAVVRPA